MSGHNFTGSYAGIILNDPNYNPVTVSSGATITNPSGVALQSTLALDWTIGNAGLIQSTGTTYGASGIALATTGTITNAQPGSIIGHDVGVSIAGAGTVINQGNITATQTTGSGYYYDTPSKVFTPFSAAIIMGEGLVSNAASATISSYLDGVVLRNGGTVINAGSIGASSSTFGFGVVLPTGGSVTNASGGSISAGRYAVLALGSSAVTAIISNAGTIAAGKDAVVAFGNASATLFNSGIIAGTTHGGALLAQGGYVSNAAAGTITGGKYAVIAYGSVASTVINQGILTATTYAGALLTHGGYVSNAATGRITGVSDGIRLAGAESFLVNFGSISSSQTIAGPGFDPAGVDLAAGGTVTNGVTGNIRATWKGVEIGVANTTVFPDSTLLNEGFIYAYGRITSTSNGTISVSTAGAAVWIHGVANISNAATGTIAGGPFGVVLYADAQITNRGTIHGTQFAIYEKYVGDSVRLINYPGAALSGKVEGSNPAGAASGILELASGASTGTIAGFGSKYIGFSNITLDASAAWSFGGTVTSAQHLAFNGANASLALANPRAMAGTITGFVPTDTIALTGITDVTGVTLGANNVLTVAESIGPSFTLQFDPAQDFSSEPFIFATAGGETRLTVACFAAGTRIQTEQGSVPVQHLRHGMRVQAHFAGTARVIWVGRRHIDCARHNRPHAVWPICIRAGAFAPGQPSADTYLSPDHAVYVNGVLIPVRHLLNGTSIRRAPMPQVTYYHVELPHHDVLLAEGLPVESYLDIGDRSNFVNGGDTIRLFADFAAPALHPATIWDANACAPLVIQGPELEAARRQLNRRAARALRHPPAVIRRRRLPPARVRVPPA